MLLGMLIGASAYLYYLDASDMRSALRSQWGTGQFILDHLAALLALLPGTLAFGYYALGRKRNAPIREGTLLRYLQFQEYLARSRPHFVEMNVSDGMTPSVDPRVASVDRKSLLARELENLSPRPWQFFFSSIALSLLFLALAAISDETINNRGYFLGKLLVPGRDVRDVDRVAEGLRGIVFTGYGVFTHTLVVLIHRIHSAALSSEFILSSTLRAALMMVIGFTLGLASPFQLSSAMVGGELRTSELGILLYFVVGAFPSWGYEALRRKARELLSPDSVETQSLSLAYVDGLDEPTIDRLAELGISNVQHLATRHPIDLTLKTQYPFRQVVDWIDQALLITVLREGIVEARKLGIGRASDLRALYLEVLPHGGIKPFKPGGAQDGKDLPHSSLPHCQRTLMLLARRSGLGSCGLDAICQRLLNNFQVIVFHELWRLPEQPLEPLPAPRRSSPGPSSPSTEPMFRGPAAAPGPPRARAARASRASPPAPARPGA
jgi:hypothetical protein